ncbi:TPA: hypothetical protein ACHVAK_001676, partial [Streptococcus suis]
FYRHLVYLLLFRSFVLPDFARVTWSAPLSPTLHSPLTVQAIWGSGLKQSGDANSPVDYSYLSLKIRERSISAGHQEI